jgi:hypothetical protein
LSCRSISRRPTCKEKIEGEEEDVEKKAASYWALGVEPDSVSINYTATIDLAGQGSSDHDHPEKKCL